MNPWSCKSPLGKVTSVRVGPGVGVVVGVGGMRVSVALGAGVSVAEGTAVGAGDGTHALSDRVNANKTKTNAAGNFIIITSPACMLDAERAICYPLIIFDERHYNIRVRVRQSFNRVSLTALILPRGDDHAIRIVLANV